jgi:hypothetical protein
MRPRLAALNESGPIFTYSEAIRLFNLHGIFPSPAVSFQIFNMKPDVDMHEVPALSIFSSESAPSAAPAQEVVQVASVVGRKG